MQVEEQQQRIFGECERLVTLLQRPYEPDEREERLETILNLGIAVNSALWPSVLLRGVPGRHHTLEINNHEWITTDVGGIFICLFDEAIHRQSGAYPWWVFLYVQSTHETPLMDEDLKRIKGGTLLNVGFWPDELEFMVPNGELGRRPRFTAARGVLRGMFMAAVEELVTTHLPSRLAEAVAQERQAMGQRLAADAGTQSVRSPSNESRWLLDAGDKLLQHERRVTLTAPALAAAVAASSGGQHVSPAFQATGLLEVRAALQQERDDALALVHRLQRRLIEVCAQLDTDVTTLEAAERLAATLTTESLASGVAFPNAAHDTETAYILPIALNIRSLRGRDLPVAEATAQTWTRAVQQICERLHGHEWRITADGFLPCPHCFLEHPATTADPAEAALSPLNTASS